MKTEKMVFACVVAIIVGGFFFTGCDDGSDDTTPKTVAVTGVTLAGALSYDLTVGDNQILDYTVQPANATNSKVKWESDNLTVATVTNRIVVARGEGTAIISVITEDGGYKKSCVVKVSLVDVDSVGLNESTLDLNIWEDVQLLATVLPANAASVNKFLTWSSNRESIATVNNGMVTGKGAGVAIITASTRNGKSASCTVTVRSVAVEGVELEISELDLEVWESQQITSAMIPANASNRNVSWTSSKTNVATVSSNGTITGVGAGEAIITVTTNEGRKTATCAVTVTFTMPIPMLPIEPGTFMMGSPETEEGHYSFENEPDKTNETQHSVTLTKGFLMGAYHVTMALYKKITGVNPTVFNVEEEAPEWLDDWPVDSVTWYDAVEFCNKLSAVAGLTPVYNISIRQPATGYPITSAVVTCNWDANGYRLPTEAEWEYACRARTETPFNFYDTETNEWGTDYIWTDWANFVAIGDYNGKPTTDQEIELWGSTVPWNLFMDYPNRWGLYNMHGMLGEWCWDLFTPGADYNVPAADDYTGPGFGLFRTLRGGSWADPAEWVRSAARDGLPPGGIMQERPPNSSGGYWVGFRVVRNMPPDWPSSKMAPFVDEQSGTTRQKGKIIPQGIRMFNGNSAPSLRNEFLRRKTLVE
jgi:formylglycine-generating enzyme required for sulfatase activity